MGVVLTWHACMGVAQEMRDPTVAPAEASTAPGVPGSAAPAPGMAVVVQDGKPHLVVGTRLVAVGQKVGNAQLERITETEIWLREGKQLRKLPRFNGIQRSVAKPPAPCKAPVANTKPRSKSAAVPAPQAVSPAVPCEGVQP
ncbi:hypothetical protein [Rhodoferax saidenbachensis]|nr:hypothetical protein [Rhodoferax saidenbachensis]